MPAGRTHFYMEFEYKKNWHARLYAQVLTELKSNAEGITNAEATVRLARFGQNRLPEEKPYSRARLLLAQFNSPLILILLIAAGISLKLNHISDAIFIGVVLLINTSVAFYQEDKVNRSLRFLKKEVGMTAKVIREGRLREIPTLELVPGDRVMLKQGDKVPADMRLVEVSDLKINESSLTGEWRAAEKEVEPVQESAPIGDQTSMAFMGTLVEDGHGVGVVVATGISSEFGKIVSLLSETREERTPLQHKILSMSRMVAAFVLVVALIVIAIGYVTGREFSDTLVAALALSVSAIPVGVLPAVTVILVLGMRRILAEKGLVRKLIANETLGGVTVICTDKTGTLTKGIMQVSRILTGSRELLSDGKRPLPKGADVSGAESHVTVLKIAALTNDAFIENPDAELHEWVVRGRATERAFLVAAAHAGLRKGELEKQYPVVERLSFTSENKFAASLHEDKSGDRLVQVIGAPEIILSRATMLDIDGRKTALDSEECRQLIAKFESLTEKGLRVVACAERKVPGGARRLQELVEKLTLVGFIALQDPLREDAKESIELTKRAGIRTIIITGDHKLTARAIAEEVGIAAEAKDIVEGVEIELMNDHELAERVQTAVIFARVSPHHKLRLVNALKQNGEVVAMVGDGINDAPALKAADVGVAVGSGTDVAKEVADIVLLDDNFRTIVKAIEQGRVIFQNIRKVFVYLVADDFSQLFLFFAAMAVGLPLPLLAAQILWINLVEDGFPDLALTTEQETTGVMDRKPRDRREPILNGELRWFMFSVFLITGFTAFLTFISFYIATDNLELTRTATFVLMGFDSLLFAYVVRSFHRPLFRRSIFSNRYLNVAALLGIALLFVAVYVPFFQRVLSTVPLDFSFWIIIAVVGLVEIALIEIAKRKIFNPSPPKTRGGARKTGIIPVTA